MVFLPSSTIIAQIDYMYNQFKHRKDSLIAVLKHYPNPDTGRAKALFEVANCAVFLKEKKEVMPFWEEAIGLSRKLRYKSVEASCLVWKGVYYKSQLKIDSAIAYIDSGIQVASGTPDSLAKYTKAYSFYLKGMIYQNQENLYTALQNYFEALKNYDSSLVTNKKRIYDRIASIYLALNNDDKAIEYYQLSEGYSSLAEIYLERNDLVHARYYINKLTPSMPDTIETQLTGGYYRLFGRIYDKENKPDSAFMFLKEALRYFNYNKFMHSDLIENVLNHLARLKMEAGDMAEAKKYVEQDMVAAKESGHKETIANALMTMAEYYNKAGNPSAAYQALHQATVLNDSVVIEANIKQANTLAAIYENDKKEKEIAQLQSDRKIQAAIVKQKSLLNIIFVLVLAAVVFSGFLLFRNFKHTQTLSKQQQLIQQQKITQLEKEKQLMTVEAMLKGQEEERTRLAKDLHDGLGGMLSGVKISFSNMKENMIMDATHLAIFENRYRSLTIP